MIGDLLELLDLPNVSPHYGLLLFVDSDCPEYFSIHKLFVLKVSKSRGELLLVLLIEYDLNGSGIVIHLEDHSHGLIMLGNNSTTNNNLEEV